jgi:hypothetical protein
VCTRRKRCDDLAGVDLAVVDARGKLDNTELPELAHRDQT